MKKRYLNHVKVVDLGAATASVRIWGEITAERNDEEDDVITLREFNEAMDAVPEGVKEITLHINTPGGACDQGNVMCSIIMDRKKTGCRFTTVNDGMVASMGTPIFALGDRRIGRVNSLFMIHKPSIFMFGGADAEQLRSTADWLDAWEDAIVTIYMKVWKGSEDELREKIRATSWIRPDDCLKYGFYTEIDGKNEVQDCAENYCVNGLYVPKDMLGEEGLFHVEDKGGEKKMIFNESQEAALLALYGEGCGDTLMAVLDTLREGGVSDVDAVRRTLGNAMALDKVQTALDDEKAARAAADGQVESLTSKLSEAAAKCQEYDKLRQEAVTNCKAGGVKALGAAFDEKAYDNILAGLTMEGITAMTRQFEAVAASALKAGTRVSAFAGGEQDGAANPDDYNF